MMLSGTRLLRAGLLGLGLAVILAVGWSLKGRPAPTPSPSPPVALPSPVSKEDTRTTGLVYRSFKAGKEAYVLEAESMVGREQEELNLRQVKLTFGYISDGEAQKGTISGDECVYSPNIQKAVFKGHVHVQTADGLDLTTETLLYRGDKGTARTNSPAEFKRKDVSGSSTGMTYSAAEDRIELSADALVRIENEGDAPTEIRSQKAVMEQGRGTLNFEGEARVTQGPDLLRADRLLLTFDPETRVLSRAIAAGGVDLKTAGGHLLPGAFARPGAEGPRHLLCRKLDVVFRPDRSISEATAMREADLTLMPGPGEVQERRRIRADNFLIFRFDEQGRVVQVQGRKDASLVAESLIKDGSTPRTVACQAFLAQLDPDTGEARSIGFSGDVVFTRGQQKATSSKARYEAEGTLLTFEGGPPELGDERGQLTANVIRVTTASGNVQAQDDVRHVLKARGHGGLLEGKDSPTLLTAGLFAHDRGDRLSRYTSGALLRSGKDEIRAANIIIQENAAGQRTLKANKSVVSILNPHSEDAHAKPQPQVLGQAEAMVYEEAANRIVYTDDAVIRQGDIVTKSPEATLTLSSDGSGLEKLEAGEPVEVQQGDRRATGRQGTYTPGDGAMVLVGEDAVLIDPQQQSRGRTLTFHVGDDRILVDGREEGRTESIFKNGPPQGPPPATTVGPGTSPAPPPTKP